MISKLFKKKISVRAPEHPSTPDGAIIWAIGDVHGRLDLLVPLVEAIKIDAAQAAAPRKVCIFLGDYIDRGPESRGVIQYLAALARDRSLEWRFLKGNHEEAMLDFLEDPTFGPQWCEYGGDATLESYGLRLPPMRHKPEPWAHLAADLEHKLTLDERAFLTTLELSVSLGDYFFAHAGARPGTPLDQQSADDLLWVRKTFLVSDVEFEQVVVHGHTPEPEIYADHRRLGVDTKAYASGVLTALRLEGPTRAALQTIGEAGAISVRSVPVTKSVSARVA